MSLILNNIYDGISGVPLVDAQADTPDQIYRCTDNTIFKPARMVVTNQTATATRLLLVDCDLTDAGSEETYKDEDYFIYDLNIAASVTVNVDTNEIPSSLQFRNGIAGYSTVANATLSVFVEGTEDFLTTTE